MMTIESIIKENGIRVNPQIVQNIFLSIGLKDYFVTLFQMTGDNKYIKRFIEIVPYTAVKDDYLVEEEAVKQRYNPYTKEGRLRKGAIRHKNDEGTFIAYHNLNYNEDMQLGKLLNVARGMVEMYDYNNEYSFMTAIMRADLSYAGAEIIKAVMIEPFADTRINKNNFGLDRLFQF